MIGYLLLTFSVVYVREIQERYFHFDTRSYLLEITVWAERCPQRFVPIDYDTSWRRSTLGVLEPESGAAADLFGDRGESVVVVPGLAFDERGGRLGRGGGHYDRFLRETRQTGHLVAIGVAFDTQIVERVPRADCDEPVDRIVTESRVIEARAPR